MLSSYAQSACTHCTLPLRDGRGRWSAQMPLGCAYWLCLPCAYLFTSKTRRNGGPVDGFEVPASFKPEWNR